MRSQAPWQVVLTLVPSSPTRKSFGLSNGRMGERGRGGLNEASMFESFKCLVCLSFGVGCRLELHEAG